MLLNCDLGESYGNWSIGLDSEVMPHIDQANIACGFHAGDPSTISVTLALAERHGVSVGAHPAYPDLAGFGRRSMQLSSDEMVASLHYQVAALDGMAASRGLTLEHIKPHGALYNDMMAHPRIMATILEAVATYHRPLPLMVLATAAADEHRARADKAGVTLLFEAFADRCYADDGTLLPRGQTQAVHDRQRMLDQVAQLQQEQSVTTVSGHTLMLHADTLCVHGDNTEGVGAIKAVRALLQGA